MTAVDSGRIVILGAGIAALSAALRLAPRPVLVISPEPLGQGASSAWAQGGVAAALGSGDSAAAHAQDTIRAGAGIVDAQMAELVAGLAPDHVAALADIGVPFDRDPDGSFALSREAAHGHPRVARVKGDQAGAAIMAALVAAVRVAPSVQVLEGFAAHRLEVQGGRVTGVWLGLADVASAPVLVMAPAVLLAAGGAAGLYAMTTNPRRIMGQALGLAARAGAMVADAEFVQFHPTAIACGEDPAPLATEALRGEGAVLINRNGERFMLAEHPDAELAPRDIVARAIFAQTQAGLAPALDTRAAIGDALPEHFPAVATACARAGIDPVTQPIPVAAAAHYHMGGVACDGLGRSSLPGLWVAGEAASTGLHGANRLASNGLLEALVMARRAADDIAAELPAAASPLPEVMLAPAPGGLPVDPGDVTHLRRLMTDCVGVIRTAEGLRNALDGLAALARKPQPDPMRNMIAAATLITAAALDRCESRGGHFRADYPKADPALAHRTLLTLTKAEGMRDQKELA